MLEPLETEVMQIYGLRTATIHKEDANMLSGLELLYGGVEDSTNSLVGENNELGDLSTLPGQIRAALDAHADVAQQFPLPFLLPCQALVPPRHRPSAPPPPASHRDAKKLLRAPSADSASAAGRSLRAYSYVLDVRTEY